MGHEPIHNHGEDHRRPGTRGADDPGGHDPTPAPSRNETGDGYTTNQEIPLSGGPVGGGGWEIDTTTLIPGHPLCYKHVGAGPDALIWSYYLHPGGHTVRFTMNFGETGVSDGVLTLKIAGAYDWTSNDQRPTGVLSTGSSDWITVATIDLSDYSGSPYYAYTTSWGLEGGAESNFSLPGPVAVPPYVLSTSIDVSNLLNGSAGYHYLRLDGEGDIVIARMLIHDSGTFIDHASVAI